MAVNKSAVSTLYERKVFVSTDGYEVEIQSNYWRLSKDVSFYLDALPGWLEFDFLNTFKQVLSIYGQTSSAAHTENLFRQLKNYFYSVSSQAPFSTASLISYRANLGTKNGWYLGYVRAFARTWVSMGYHGIPPESVTLMEKWKIRGNEKGFAVQSMCPESGPLTDTEMQGIVARVTECYAEGRLKLRDSCYAMVLAMTGRRSVQIASLKVKDLLAVNGKYLINFPRAKQRNTPWRSSFKTFPIVEDLWLLLHLQVEAVKSLFEQNTGRPVPDNLAPELPIFPCLENFKVDQDLESQLSGDFLHARSNESSQAMNEVKRVINVISERTGAPTHLNPTRFRYTLGTNLAREGRGEYVIAEALDHSDTQNTGVYVKNIPGIVKHIDKAVALSLAPIAQAFQGVLVKDETKARRGSDPSSRICSRGGNVGSCGSYGFCGAHAPIACYTCSHFQPWLDGPHEFVLNQLISERDSVFATTGDLKIASVNDRLILAVGDVVTRCNAMKGEVADV